MIKIDLEQGIVTLERDGRGESYLLSSAEAFRIVSQAWLRAGWDAKYVYSFTWMGRPIIQLPDDMVRAQEAIYLVQPDVIIETGIAHGGSLVFYASLCKAMGRGRIVGIDLEIRPHNRSALETHELADYITLIEGSSTDPEVVSQVHSLVRPGERTMVFLDSNHTMQHVADELEAYAGLVSVGSYIVATDGIMKSLVGAPRSAPDWAWNNPQTAVETFLSKRSDFVLEPPPFVFNEGVVTSPVTYWENAWLRRVA